ncbi:hypothetical protein JR316_0000404 [Psilocybe cubensis]|uniref:BHLH domain-containing protein n=2 Tax=Psilocybe cubensis TaxID=181762 RepID=A0A8H7YAB8_PSICU|nr:hypothetical protein JR316_0000404 [Psilocybe cubensis]KAH9486340.1 hypothetical protein JR316_0000404 [Psilocybe cubensis]
MDPHVDDPAASVPVYNFYHSTDHDSAYAMGYPPSLASYASIPHPSARAQIVPDIHPNYLAMQQQQQQQHYPGNVFASSPALSNTPPPPSPDNYEALSPPLSGSDTSADGLYHHSNSSSANSPSSSRGHSLVHRTTPNRYNPPPSPSSSGSRHRRGRSQGDSDDEEMGLAYNAVENLANTRKEATRRQRIEAEQRRRDELRDGYAKLKDALPSSNQKSSKVTLLERATNHIRALEEENQQLQKRIAELEADAQRLRALNEKISLSTEGTPSPEHAATALGGRPLSPPPDVLPGSNPTAAAPAHSLVSVRGQHMSSEHSSPSASEGGH